MPGRATGWFPSSLNGWTRSGESLRGWGGRARAPRNSKVQILDFEFLIFDGFSRILEVLRRFEGFRHLEHFEPRIAKGGDGEKPS